MNRFNSITKPLTWFMALLLTAFVAGCGGGSSGIGAGTVTPATVTSITVTMPIAVTPATASIPVAGTQQFVATAKYSDSTTSDVTKSASWTSSNAGATVGLHTGLAIGVTANVTPVIITATFGGKTATAALTVTPATLMSIAVTPATASIPAGGTKLFVATGTYSDSTTSVVTATANWTSGNAGATVGLHTGLATGVTANVTPVVITATLSGKTATAALTVTAVAAGPVVCTGTTGTTGNNCVALGTAANYVILAEAAITNVPTSNVTGDIGLFPTTGAAIGITCAEVTGAIYSADAAGPACKVTDGTGLNLAVQAKLAAYNDGFARVETAPANLNVGAGTLNATTVPSGLAPGAYVWTSAVTIPTDLTLVGTGAATDVWVFKVGGTLDVGANIIPSGGALPQNVFWVTSGAVTVAAGKHMEGVVLSAGDITLITGASASGRLLSATQVILQSAIVTKP